MSSIPNPVPYETPWKFLKRGRRLNDKLPAWIVCRVFLFVSDLPQSSILKQRISYFSPHHGDTMQTLAECYQSRCPLRPDVETETARLKEWEVKEGEKTGAGESASRSTTVPVSFTGHRSSLVTTLCVAK